MKKLNIPIVTDVPPDASYTAGQVLHRIISSLPDIKFEFFWVNHSGLPGHITIPNNCSIKRIFDFHLHGIWWVLARFTKKVGERSTVLRKVGLLVRLSMWILKTISIGLRLGFSLRKSPSRLVWCVVQGEKTVLCYVVAGLVSRRTLILQQWDPLSWWMTHRGHPRKAHEIMRKVLNWLERRAILNVVPSDAWKMRLLAEGKKSIRLDNFFDDPMDISKELVFLSDPQAIHAVFVGQFYSNAELELLIGHLTRTLAALNKKLVLHYFGHAQPSQTALGYRLIAHGALPRDELVKRIAKWDLALLPYPTEARFLETSSFSFPSKSRVYLAAGLPIIAWASAGASPDIFYKQHYSAYYHNALVDDRTEEFVSAIIEASPSQRKSRHQEATRILGEQFSYSSELVPFKEFLVEHA